MCAGASAAAAWLWRDDHGWSPYGPTESAALTAAQAAGQSGVDFQFGSTRYHVDFGTMTQTNTVTGFQRPIQYMPASGAGGGSSAGAGGAGAGSASGGASPQFGVIHTETCDPVSAATAAEATRDTVASLTGWRTAASWEELKEQSCSVCIMDFDREDDSLEDIVMLGQCSGHYFHAGSSRTSMCVLRPASLTCCRSRACRLHRAMLQVQREVPDLFHSLRHDDWQDAQG